MTTKEKLKNYFLNGNKLLKALDKTFTSYYSGVTYEYIKEYVCNNESDEDELNAELFNLLLESKIGLMYCSDINKVTFSRQYNQCWMGITSHYKPTVSIIYSNHPTKNI